MRSTRSNKKTIAYIVTLRRKEKDLAVEDHSLRHSISLFAGFCSKKQCVALMIIVNVT